MSSRPLRVGQVVGKMVGGGVEQVVLNYYRHIDRSTIQFDFIVDADSTLIPSEEIEALGGRVIIVPPYQDIISNQRELIKLFKQEKWPIIHSHLNALSVFPLRAAKVAGIPVRIAHSHSTSGRGELRRNVLKAMLRPVSNVYPTYRMACSNHSGKWLFGNKTNFKLIYNAIELNKFNFDKSSRDYLRSELGISDNTIVIGHIGRFTKQKNQEFLLRVMSSLEEGESGKYLLMFVGSGPLQQEVKEKADKLGLTESVHFFGQREDVEKLYQVFDVLCLPSIYEGLGIVAIEAQRSGLPVVASNMVPQEVRLTDEVSFLSLDQPERWASLIEGLSTSDRCTKDSEFFSNYDIERAAILLRDTYIQLFEQSKQWM